MANVGTATQVPLLVQAAITTNGNNTVPVLVFAGKGCNVSIFGTFTGTVALQRCFVNSDGAGALTPPAIGTFRTITSWTAPVETQFTEVEQGAWYALVATAAMTGTANVRIGQNP